MGRESPLTGWVHLSNTVVAPVHQCSQREGRRDLHNSTSKSHQKMHENDFSVSPPVQFTGPIHQFTPVIVDGQFHVHKTDRKFHFSRCLEHLTQISGVEHLQYTQSLQQPMACSFLNEFYQAHTPVLYIWVMNTPCVLLYSPFSLFNLCK